MDLNEQLQIALILNFVIATIGLIIMTVMNKR